MDYLAISRNIQGALAKAGIPLSEDQFVMLAGSLAVYLQGAAPNHEAQIRNQINRTEKARLIKDALQSKDDLVT